MTVYTLTVTGRDGHMDFFDREIAEDMAAHQRAKGFDVTLTPDTEPTHRCPGCAEVLWADNTDDDIPCLCGELAAPIDYCPECDAPDCMYH